MSIGSAPEIGTQFTTWGKMDEAARVAWHEHMRTHWGPDLLNGYGTLVRRPTNAPNNEIHHSNCTSDVE